MQQNPGESGNPGIPGITQWFKTMTTNDYIRGVRNAGWRPFDRRLWQRNYYEHIVRKDGSIDRIRNYIDGTLPGGTRTPTTCSPSRRSSGSPGRPAARPFSREGRHA
jgi:hypothetical protein